MTVKRVFYITSDNLAIFLWREGGWREELSLPNSPGSLDAFDACLVRQPDVISCLLVDLVEEEHRNETVPHVGGRDRRALLQRKMKHLFRGTPYCTAQLRGREKFGRRDARVLFSALTNPDAVEFWLEGMIRRKVPIAGIYSLPLISQQLLKGLKINGAHTLLLSRHRNNLLRQSFFTGYDLKASRLSSRETRSGEAWLEFLLDEVQRTRRYLGRQQLLPQGAPLDICILSQGDQLECLKAGCVDTDSSRYHFIDLNEVLVKLHLKGDIPADRAELLFVHLVRKAKSRLDYARPADRRYFIMHQARLGLMAAGMLLALGSAGWSAGNIFYANELKEQTATASHQIRQLRKRYERALAAMPEVPANPRAMRSAVEIGKELKRRKSSPRAMLVALSKGLAVNPHIQLDEIRWRATDHPDAQDRRRDSMEDMQPGPDDMPDMMDENTAAMPAEDGTAEDGMQDHGGALYQIAIIKGWLDPAGADYHTTFKLVEDFIKTLRRDRAFVAVEALAMPVNVDPAVVLAGESKLDVRAARAMFEIKAVMRVDHDAV
ncbi:MAG TPA: hypothetical protein ENI99_03925 [Sedimenticola sp.]|nr:hypothetical protein [Sedimenticola sp.]